MEFEESIYNLIPKEAYVPPKEKRHVSKHDPLSAPTSSTFCLNTTSKPKVSNVSGVAEPTGSNHTNRGHGNTFGLPKGAAKPNAGTFRLKGTGTIHIPDPSKYNRDGPKKVAVPKIDEKPIMGLVSDKNFIVSNAVENILAAPKLPGNNNKEYLKKKNYGKVPRYLQTIKKEIEDEYQLVREMQIEDEAELDRQKFLMNEEEK